MSAPLLYSTDFGSGNPLIILHGLFGSSDNWRSIARQLTDRFHVYTLDLRNHGRSFHRKGMSYSELAQDVYHWCQANGLRQVILLGHSMGGKTAMQFAHDYPDMLSALVVADIAPVKYGRRHDHILAAFQAIDPSQYTDLKAIDEALSHYIEETGLRQFLLKNIRRDSGTSTYLWELNFEAIQEGYEDIAAAPQFSRPVQTPTLFIKGEKSDFIQKEGMDVIQKYFPHSKTVTIASAGHWLHAENPEHFLAELREFLQNPSEF